MKIIPIIIVSVLLTSACSSNTKRYGDIDKNDKSITVPAGSAGLKGAVKDALIQNGWRLALKSNTSITEGTTGEKTLLKHYNASNTRYTLSGTSSQIDICVLGGGFYSYDLFIIDNKTREEVMTFDGMDCENTIAKNIIKALNQ